MRKEIAALVAFAALGMGCARDDAPLPLRVFAAASLRDVATDLGEEYERLHGRAVQFNFAGSNTLAQQIRAAPRVDAFLSADDGWIDFVEERGHVVTGTRRAVLGNRLVAIRHRDSDLRVDDPADLATAPFRHLALADPGAVPAGRYARFYLERAQADLWPALADRVVPALDVRAALQLVASDPDIVGVVYRTDVAASDRVRPLFEFPPRDDMPVVYWAVAIRNEADPEAGARFVEFLDGPQAREIGRRHGFPAVSG